MLAKDMREAMIEAEIKLMLFYAGELFYYRHKDICNEKKTAQVVDVQFRRPCCGVPRAAERASSVSL